MATKADVFIIESLDPDDEGNGRFEGSSVSHILRLHGKDPKYRYVRTRKQFRKALKEFANSQYRYLHIFAHADEDGMCTTNLDEIHYSDLAELLKPCMAEKRLFLSACAMVHEQMAKAIIPLTNCISIVGPREAVRFSDAAVLWPAIYHLMFSAKDSAMTHNALKKNLAKVSALFGVELGYYSRSKILKRGYTYDLLKAYSAVLWENSCIPIPCQFCSPFIPENRESFRNIGQNPLPRLHNQTMIINPPPTLTHMRLYFP